MTTHFAQRYSLCACNTLDDFDGPDGMVRGDSAPDPDEAPWGRFGGDAETGSLFRQPAHSRRDQRRAARAAREAWLD
jgi:hypothetical protein